MLKKILVPTDGYKSSLISVDYAIDIAKLFDSEITGLSVIDIKRLRGPFIHDLGTTFGGMVPCGNFMETVSSMLQTAADAALTQLEEKCKENGVKYKLKKETGVITKEIANQAIEADLIAMGKTGEHTEWSDQLLGSNVEAVVRQTHKPVLVASETLVKPTKILVAYDGSEYADKALNIGAEIDAKMEKPMTLLTVNDDEKKAADIVAKGAEILKPRNVEFDTIIEKGDPAIVIFDKYMQGHYNMLVMGAYGHSKIRELVIGSTTAQLMRKIDCPMLISR